MEMLWRIIAKRLNMAAIAGKEAASRTIIDGWNAIDMSITKSLCASPPARRDKMASAGLEAIQPSL
jgi:hypothetical protein